MTINTDKLQQALKYQARTLTMNDKANQRLGTDFFHWAIVRKVRSLKGSSVSITDVKDWLKTK